MDDTVAINIGYKVIIPCAGLGSRLNDTTKYIPKALVSLGEQTAISRILLSFPKTSKFIIPVGYKGELIKEYIYHAHDDLDITFVDILHYAGEGSGLGYTLNQCKEYLQEPFVFCSCDTIVINKIPKPTYNWMGWDNRDMLNQYRTISLNESNTKIIKMNDKGINLNENPKPYIGLCGIYDYQSFWNIMNDSDKCISLGESYALNQMIQSGENIGAVKFNWFDIGIQIELENSMNKFEEESSINVLPKKEEAIWIVNDKAIKFHQDYKFISDRLQRAKALNEFIPKTLKQTTHMFSSERIHGSVLGDCISIPLFRTFLEFSKKFWKIKELNDNEQTQFKIACNKFYKSKTLERLKQFYANKNINDISSTINSESYPSLEHIMEHIDWDWLCSGFPTNYHGDYHFENIIYDNIHQEFKLVDWRQNFGGLTESLLNTGDVYYDLAKLLHGLIVSHEIIHKDLYSVDISDISNFTFDYNRKQILVDCENFYYDWLDKNKYDVKKVKVLTAIIFLNIAPLHHDPYSYMLYMLGKTMLHKALR